MTLRAWQVVMDSENNPLSKIPKIVRFQLMSVLSVLWSLIFSLNAGIIIWFPELVIAHIVLILIGVFGTKMTFSFFFSWSKLSYGYE